MAGIDIINNMSNKELVDYYKYCMTHRYEELRLRGVNYHPNFNYCSVYVGGKTKLYKLQYDNEMFLLNLMWDRMHNSNFLNTCWWLAQKVFQTNISLPFATEVEIPIQPTIPIQSTEKEVLEYKGEKFEFLASGTKRKTYLSPCKKYVIKVPKEPYTLGLLENKREAEVYANNKESIYAECELIENGWLKMEFVEPKYFSKSDDYPDWTLSIAEHQVGYNLNGKLVAYDYGSDI